MGYWISNKKVESLPNTKGGEFAKLSCYCRIMATLDLSNGYWQVSVATSSVEKTAYITEFGKYAFTYATWLCWCAGHFPGAHEYTACWPLLLCRSKHGRFNNFCCSWSDEISHLNQVFIRLKVTGLTAEPGKYFMAMRVWPRPHCRSWQSQNPINYEVIAMCVFFRLVRKKYICSFLGLAGYYCWFIPHFADVALLLTDASKMDQPDMVCWMEKLEFDEF